MTAQKPAMGAMVHYRGKMGLKAPRPAVITTTAETLASGGPEQPPWLALDSDMHVHLHVFTPSEHGSFTEFNVPYSDGDEPGTWHYMQSQT